MAAFLGNRIFRLATVRTGADAGEPERCTSALGSLTVASDRSHPPSRAFPSASDHLPPPRTTPPCPRSPPPHLAIPRRGRPRRPPPYFAVRLHPRTHRPPKPYPAAARLSSRPPPSFPFSPAPADSSGVLLPPYSVLPDHLSPNFPSFSAGERATPPRRRTVPPLPDLLPPSPVPHSATPLRRSLAGASASPISKPDCSPFSLNFFLTKTASSLSLSISPDQPHLTPSRPSLSRELHLTPPRSESSPSSGDRGLQRAGLPSPPTLLGHRRGRRLPRRPSRPPSSERLLRARATPAPGFAAPLDFAVAPLPERRPSGLSPDPRPAPCPGPQPLSVALGRAPPGDPAGSRPRSRCPAEDSPSGAPPSPEAALSPRDPPRRRLSAFPLRRAAAVQHLPVSWFAVQHFRTGTWRCRSAVQCFLFRVLLFGSFASPQVIPRLTDQRILGNFLIIRVVRPSRVESMMKSVPRFPLGNPVSCVYYHLAALDYFPMLLGWRELDGFWIPGLFGIIRWIGIIFCGVGNYFGGYSVDHFGLNILVGNGFSLVWDILQVFVGALPSSWVCPGIEEVLPKFLQNYIFIDFKTGFRK